MQTFDVKIYKVLIIFNKYFENKLSRYPLSLIIHNFFFTFNIVFSFSYFFSLFFFYFLLSMGVFGNDFENVYNIFYT